MCSARYYELARDHGQKDSNWSALMSTCMLNSLLAWIPSSERDDRLAGLSRHRIQPAGLAGLRLPQLHRAGRHLARVAAIRRRGRSASVPLTWCCWSATTRRSNLFGVYPNLPTSLPRISYLRYPNGAADQFWRRASGRRRPAVLPLRTGVSTRAGPGPDRSHIVLRLADQRRRGGGDHNRSTLNGYASSGPAR